MLRKLALILLMLSAYTIAILGHIFFAIWFFEWNPVMGYCPPNDTKYSDRYHKIWKEFKELSNSN